MAPPVIAFFFTVRVLEIRLSFTAPLEALATRRFDLDSFTARKTGEALRPFFRTSRNAAGVTCALFLARLS